MSRRNYSRDFSTSLTRRDVPLDRLSTVEEVVTRPQWEQCDLCGKMVPLEDMNDHVYNECPVKQSMDEMNSFDEFEEILNKKLVDK